MEKVVSKFGGTSMGDAKCMIRSAQIAMDHKAFIIVVSAVSGITNKLIELSQKAQSSSWDSCQKIISEIETQHLQIAEELEAPKTIGKLSPLFEELGAISRGIYLLKDCSPRALDALVSLGERLSSVLFVAAVEKVVSNSGSAKTVAWLDVREIMRTDDQFGKARPQLESIQELAANYFAKAQPKTSVFITQGFVGRTEEGLTTTLGRGGSDYSAALLAEAVGADALEIWTDVPGIATTDPRICKAARPLKEISFKEASELATFGAKVLHPSTLAPAMRRNIPVFVGSSFDPDECGTWIRKEVGSAPLLRALALRKKQVLVTLSTPEMLHSHGFLFKIFKVFNDNMVSIDAITTSEISVSLTLDDATLLNKKLIYELAQIAEVQIEENLSLVSLIGNNINHTAGIAKKTFDLISDINVRMICLGASKHNFCFLVGESHGPEAIQRLHQGFELGI